MFRGTLDDALLDGRAEMVLFRFHNTVKAIIVPEFRIVVKFLASSVFQAFFALSQFRF